MKKMDFIKNLTNRENYDQIDVTFDICKTKTYIAI